MLYEGFSLILSRNILHHKEMNTDHRLSHNSTVVGVKLVDSLYFDIGMFSAECTELGCT